MGESQPTNHISEEIGGKVGCIWEVNYFIVHEHQFDRRFDIRRYEFERCFKLGVRSHGLWAGAYGVKSASFVTNFNCTKIQEGVKNYENEGC